MDIELEKVVGVYFMVSFQIVTKSCVEMATKVSGYGMVEEYVFEGIFGICGCGE